MIAGVLELDWQAIRKEKITDDYSVHRVVYSLFEDLRNDKEKLAGSARGFLYADKGGDHTCRKILFLSNRAPVRTDLGCIRTKDVPESFLQAELYRFEVTVNAVKRDIRTEKIVPVKGRADILRWFAERAPKSWGFSVADNICEVKTVEVSKFNKVANAAPVVIQKATVTGILKVTDRNLFIQSFEHGIGRGKAFGCGLLQIVPIH